MALPESAAAYTDCYELFDKALADPLGVRALIGKHGDAAAYQMRLNKARKIERDESKRLYPRDEPQWNKSQYDGLKVTLEVDTEGEWWVYITPHRKDLVVVQGLSELAGIDPAQPQTHEDSDDDLPDIDEGVA